MDEVGVKIKLSLDSLLVKTKAVEYLPNPMTSKRNKLFNFRKIFRAFLTIYFFFLVN